MDFTAGAIALSLFQKGKQPIQIIQHELLGGLRVQISDKRLTFPVNRLLGTDSDLLSGRRGYFGGRISANIALLQHSDGQQPKIELGCRQLLAAVFL